jgi:hypothetical protein
VDQTRLGRGADVGVTALAPIHLDWGYGLHRHFWRDPFRAPQEKTTMPDNTIQLNQVGKKLPKEVEPQSGDVVIKSKDTNPPGLPTITRAFCFEHITDPSTHVHPNPPPAPPPNPPYRRDPFLLELGNVELGSKVQLISLSDDPSATFDNGNDFELAFTGYDSNARSGTVL